MPEGKVFRVTGGRETAADLAALGASLVDALAAETQAAAKELQAAVRTNASTGFHSAREGHIPGTGPGPNVVTGDYLRSVKVEYRAGAFNPANPGQLARGGVGTTAVIYTTAAQALRLEYGFHGIDSLGRSYRQPAYPHWGPAVEQVEPEYVRAVEAAVNAAVVDNATAAAVVASVLR